MPRIVKLRLLEVSPAPRPNLHWTDQECDARLMCYLHDDERSCARWRTVLRGLGLVVIGAVLVVLMMSW